jgi:hypothetical protein
MYNNNNMVTVDFINAYYSDYPKIINNIKMVEDNIENLDVITNHQGQHDTIIIDVLQTEIDNYHDTLQIEIGDNVNVNVNANPDATANTNPDDIYNEDIYNPLQNSNLLNDNFAQGLTLSRLPNIKSHNLLIKTGIKKSQLSKWKENIKNVILENIIQKNMIQKNIIIKYIPDKNTTVNFFETDDFYIANGEFIIKDNKKWLNEDMMPVLSEHGEREHAYYFKDLHNVPTDNLSTEEKLWNKITERQKEYRSTYERQNCYSYNMIQELENTRTDQEIFTRIIENKQYADYNNDCIEVNDNLLLETLFYERVTGYDCKNLSQIIKDINENKDNIIKNKIVEQKKTTIDKTRNETIRKLIYYINEKKKLE